MQNIKSENKKSHTRTPKEIHITVLPEHCQTKAEELIKLFGFSPEFLSENIGNEYL